MCLLNDVRGKVNYDFLPTGGFGKDCEAESLTAGGIVLSTTMLNELMNSEGWICEIFHQLAVFTSSAKYPVMINQFFHRTEYNL
jgi:hypothetical protein